MGSGRRKGKTSGGRNGMMLETKREMKKKEEREWVMLLEIERKGERNRSLV